ncbi:hypothetical protein PRIPAC_90489 [Pristionchus pacificus]|uniref:Uncharacterized protein n=1 Tax=Pristionchus pacificus TaxID=54126 RepID=A0A454XS07_PRIPA|nr:hypothetical protein PRIPAC_90489 [Pristionchus pacificus]|eukprot:PDM81425.1 hypothetical protein PRIPAC_35301 [Pristionchus pacificus]
MPRLSLVVLFTLAATATADSSLIDSLFRLQPLVLKSSSTCPVPLVGQSCPHATEFYYFSCCGDFNKDCCLELQDWITTSLLLILLSIVICIFGTFCCMCRKRSD